MFREIRDVIKKDDKARRWFQDDYFDLIVWYDPDGSVYGFQLCYDRNADEHSFTWEKGKGLFHHRIDTGESAGGMSKRTPILVSDGVFPARMLQEKFKACREGLEPGLYDLVMEKIAEFPSPAGRET